MIDLSALKSEIVSDPLAYGYGSLTDGDAADALNNQDGTRPRTVNNASVDTGTIRAAITFDAYDGLVTAERQWFDWLTQNGVIPVNSELLQTLAGIPTANGSIWAAADRTATNAAMAALMQRAGSRAEELWGLGTRVTARQVIDARALP